MNLHAILLSTHGVLRWVLVVVLGLAVVASGIAVATGQSRSARLAAPFSAVVGVADLQLTVGLGLYLGTSPLVRTLFESDFELLTTAALFWFFGAVHPLAMLLAIAVLHFGRVRATSKPDPGPDEAAPRRVVCTRTMFTTTAVASLLVVLAIPWPGLPWGRGL